MNKSVAPARNQLFDATQTWFTSVTRFPQFNDRLCTMWFLMLCDVNPSPQCNVYVYVMSFLSLPGHAGW